MLVLKHLYGLSYDDLEREVRANLVYRAFARISCDRVPDAKTILKIAKALGPEVIQTLHQRVVALAVAAGVAKGRRLRIDTTVVETNVHYPTDSSLLGDSVRVLPGRPLESRTSSARVGTGCGIACAVSDVEASRFCARPGAPKRRPRCSGVIGNWSRRHGRRYVTPKRWDGAPVSVSTGSTSGRAAS